MNVSKINIFNVKRQGVSPFGGDTPNVVNNRELWEQQEERSEKATKFLKGAGIVSAAILAVAYAGRAGVFRNIGRKKVEPEVVKPAVEEVKETIEEIFARKEPVKQIPATFSVQKVPVEGERSERLKRTSVNMEKVAELFDFSTYKKCKNDADKVAFWQNFRSTVEGLSYEYQYDLIPQYIKFISGLAPEELNVSFLSHNLKRDNFERYIISISEFAGQHPEYTEVFKDAKVRFANNYVNYTRQTDNLDKEVRDIIFPPVTNSEYQCAPYRAAFFTNSDNLIARKPNDKQIEEFKKYLDFLKFIGVDRVKNSILFTLGKFAKDDKIDNNIKMAGEAIEFVKKNPEFNDVIVDNLVSYELDKNFALELVYNKFGTIKLDHENNEIKAYTEQYNRHIDTIIKLRKMLIESGLRCNEKTRMKNRQDWFNIKDPSINKYTLGFQFSPKVKDIRYAAFEYDMKQGVTREEADMMIRHLTELNETSDDYLTEKILGIKLEDAVKIINESVIS